MKRRLVLGLLTAVLAAVGLIAWWIWRTREPEPSVPQALYEKHCAVCHGVQGDGQGEAAYLVQPKPRNFRAGKYRLVSSQNLQPTHEDLFRTISRGMPGTPMPSWAHLPEGDRRALADYVLQLNRAGWYDKGIELGYSPAEAESYASEMTDPGELITIPPEPEVREEGLRAGQQYFLTACANCHGQNGEGRQDPTWRTAEGYPSWSRNLKEGVFKGGREGEQLYLRFFTGLPGTPMPSGTLPGEKVWRVVQYVQSLSDPAAQEQAQIRATEIVAPRLQTVPGEPSAPGWGTVPSTRIALMPLWWHEGYIDAVRIKAAHDGQRLVLLLEWDDATRDGGGVRQQSFPDGAAVQLTASMEPPLFAMGQAGEPVNIWHWKALWSEDQKAFQDVDAAFPNMVVDAYYGSEEGWQSGPMQDSTYRPAADFHNLVASSERTVAVEDANAAGLGTLTSQSSGKQNLQGKAEWKEGVWRLQLVRNLNSPDAEDISLRPGGKLSVAFAVWDGSASDRNGQKNVSIWNTLNLKQ